MVELEVRDEILALEVLGWHKLWTFRGQLRFPLRHVASVARASDDFKLNDVRGWRIPGTHVPMLIVAGSYYHDGDWEFWDVTHPEKTIFIELRDEPYTRLVVDVADPERDVQRLRAATD